MVRPHTVYFVTAWLAVLFLGPTPIHGALGEAVELKRSTTIQVPRPNSVELKRPNTANPSEKPEGIDGGGFITPPPASNTDALTRELKRLQEKRDWIFQKPENLLMDDKTAAFLKKEDEHEFLEFKTLGKDKGAHE